MSFKRILWTSLLMLVAFGLPATSQHLFTPHASVLRADGGAPIPTPPPLPTMTT